MSVDTASRAAESVARRSYGKLVAALAVRSRNIAAAEDALGEALLRAIIDWRRNGVPANPEGWLITTARRIDADRWRRAVTAAKGAEHWMLQEDERLSGASFEIPDDRLRLLFVCAHPAIDSAMHTPLMLQVVLGIDARRIASAFLVSPSTMGQRLSRAKARIAESGLRFELPEREHVGPRTGAVLTAVYGAYSLGWDLAFSSGEQGRNLVDEALWLMRLMVEIAPDNSEALALLALGLFAHARQAARRDPETLAYVPLGDQDPALWDARLLAEAEETLRRAGTRGAPGRFGYEAAIQAVHVARRQTGLTDWSAIEHLYRGLLSCSPTLGAMIGHAVAVAEIDGPEPGIRLLDEIPQDRSRFYQPYWAARAHLHERRGSEREAAVAYDTAIALTEDAAARRYLLDHRAGLTA
ncbi:MAG: RNA polymerase subunit sigma-70 [Rhizobium sp.]|nr:RNA polymerase subunit sigma-70 [Rhizobium sp.]